MGSNLFATKPIERILAEAEGGSHRLKRVLGPVGLIAMGIGAVIGAGIFVATGKSAHDIAGPALMLSYVVAGMTCIFAALCYAEFAAMVPVAGSAYTYAYATLGELLAWIIGWDLVLEYAVGAATVANGWSGYLSKSILPKIGITLPTWCSTSPWAYDANAGLTSTGSYFDLPAVLIAIAVTLVLVKGIKESAGFNALMVALKLSAVLFVIIVGAHYVNPDNWHPFAPYGYGGLSVFGHEIVGGKNAAGHPVGVLAGAAIVFFAYIGFDAVSTQAEEAKNPKRDIPIGIMGSLIVCTILYIAVVAVLTGMVKYDQIDIHAGVSSAFKSVGLGWAEFMIAIAGVAGITSVLLVMMLSAPRVFLAMARDGLLPKSFFGAVHPKFQTPWKSTLLVGAVVAVMAGLFPIDWLLDLTNIGTMLAFVIVCAAVLVMRKTNPNTPRPFRCPWVPLVPILGILFCVVLMCSLPAENWYRLIGWLVIGLVIYFAYGRHRSILAVDRASGPRT